MFCPRCQSEFRPGFTHCGSCNVDLVETLSVSTAVDEPRRTASRTPISRTRLVDYCGFLDLDEARAARNALREAGIGAEISIRDLDAVAGSPLEEEFWLRVDVDAVAKVAAIVGYEPAVEEVRPLTCSECEATVAEDDDACPECGARFEEN